MTVNRGAFAFGSFDAFAVDLAKTSKTIVKIGKGVAALSDTGGAYMSKSLASAAVVHIQQAIKTKGGSINRQSYAPHSEAYKEASLHSPKFLQAEGALLASIKVLNRRYSSGRGSVAGIDVSATTPHIGWRGIASGRIKIADYAYTITYGSGNVPGRPVIPQAIEDFLHSAAPQIFPMFWKKMCDNWQDDFKTRKDTPMSASTRDAYFLQSLRGAGWSAQAIAMYQSQKATR